MGIGSEGTDRRRVEKEGQVHTREMVVFGVCCSKGRFKRKVQNEGVGSGFPQGGRGRGSIGRDSVGD